MLDVLPWHFRLRDIGEKKSFSFSASEEQRVAMAEALDVIAVERLDADLTARVSDGARVHVHGELRGEIIQACVVSLDPVPQTIREAIHLVFWPRDRLPTHRAEEEVSPFDDETPEPYDGDRIEIGHIIYELVASSLDPYPRVPGASLEHTIAGRAQEQDEGENGGPPNPFAALKGLKERD